MSECNRGSSRSLVAAGTGLIAVTYGLIRFGYGLQLPTFSAAFGLPSSVAGGIGAGGFAGYCLAALLAQRLIDAGRFRLTLWLAGGLAALGALVVAGAWSSVSLAAGVIVGGSAAGAASPALVAAVGATVPVASEDRAQALVNSGTGVGVVVGGLLVAALADQWRVTWAGFALAAVLATWAVDRRARWPAASLGPRSGDVRGAWADLAVVRPALLAALLAGAGSAAVWTFGRELLATTGELSSGTTALLWCVLGGAGVLGAFSGDLVRRLGLRVAWTTTAAVTAVATIVLGCQSGALAVAAIALAAFGGGYVGLSGVLIAWAVDAVPQRPAAATAALFIALTAGQAVGALTLGVITQSTSLTISFLIAAALLLLSSLATQSAGSGARGPRRRQRRRRPRPAG